MLIWDHNRTLPYIQRKAFNKITRDEFSWASFLPFCPCEFQSFWWRSCRPPCRSPCCSVGIDASSPEQSWSCTTALPLLTNRYSQTRYSRKFLTQILHTIPSVIEINATVTIAFKTQPASTTQLVDHLNCKKKVTLSFHNWRYWKFRLALLSPFQNWHFYNKARSSIHLQSWWFFKMLKK